MTMLVCPGCRTRTAERLDVRTLARDGDVLVCECGRRYPIVDSVPIVMTDPARAEIDPDLSPEVAALLVANGPDDAPYPRLLEHLSTYLDAHWGDRAAPPPPGFGAAALVDKIAGLDHAGATVELGCSVGRIAAELARRADHVVGVDLQLGAVRRARRLLAGEPLVYSRRIIGRHYAAATIAPGDRATDRVSLVCGDVLDPPLIHETFDRVVALNMLDSVRSPRQLLSVVDGLCKRGGEVILSSPYSWQSNVMAEHERLGDAPELVAILTGGTGLSARYAIADEAELPWTLRRDARSAVTYGIHYLRARKL